MTRSRLLDLVVRCKTDSVTRSLGRSVARSLAYSLIHSLTTILTYLHTSNYSDKYPYTRVYQSMHPFSNPLITLSLTHSLTHCTHSLTHIHICLTTLISTQVYESIHASIDPSIHPSIWSSIYHSILAHRVTRMQAGSCTRAQTHIHTCKSTHLSILCPSRPSVACIHTRTFRHAYIYAYIYAYSKGLVAQLAAWKICNLSSVQGLWYRTHVQPNSFCGDWSWWAGFCSHSLSTTESSKAVVINWRKYVLFVLVNCFCGIRMPGNGVCRVTDCVRYDHNSVNLAVKCQSNKIHRY